MVLSSEVISVGGTGQCGKFGQFWNILATNFITKVALIFGDILGSCEKHCSLSQTGQATFWSTFGKTWATFSSIFGHTGAGEYFGLSG